MTPHELVWWAILVAVVIVFALTGARVARILSGTKRLLGRIDDLQERPVVKALAKAERDQRRIAAALAQIEPLTVRAESALAIIRRGPLPPQLTGAIRRLRDELAAFRAFAP